MLVDATAVKRRGEGHAIEAIKPPRLNFARRCLYCMERDCDSAACRAMHERSRWAVCPQCDRREGDELVSTRCDWCTFGVVELAPRIEVVVGER